MSTTESVATVTYPFYETTYTNPSPSPLSSYPTTYTDSSWLPPMSADTDCAAASAYPSIEGPLGLQPACVISNAAEINPNAFWDVYQCCPGHDLSSYSYSFGPGEPSSEAICMMQCYINETYGVTWQEVGRCLQKRVKEVVCMPRFEERAKNETTGGSTSGVSRQPGEVTTGSTGEPPSATSQSSTGQSNTASGSSGATASFNVVQTNASMIGMAVFLFLAVGSAAAVFL